jgi:hypothetical protein
MTYPDAFGYNSYYEPKTKVELKIDLVTSRIRCKHGWEKKVSNNEVVKKWGAECKMQGVDEKAFAFIMEVRNTPRKGQRG